MMKVWEIQSAYGIENLNLVEKPQPKPGPGQIVVSIKAASLNYRDLLTVIGYGGGYALPLIAFSVGVGEGSAAGGVVWGVCVGERVGPLFFQSWLARSVAAGSRNRPLWG